MYNSTVEKVQKVWWRQEDKLDTLVFHLLCSLTGKEAAENLAIENEV